MSSYTAMAESYNQLMRDIDYCSFINFYEQIFSLYRKKPRSVLDIGCGTGTLAYLLADRGYDVTAADPSVEMLSRAVQNSGERPRGNPLFLCQDFQTLDLYGTVECAVSSLDCINYITDPEMLQRALKRVLMFLEPGGLFIFDVNSVSKFLALRDGLFLDQTEDVYCIWRTDFSEQNMLCRYNVDLFQRRGELWELTSEEHLQRAYTLNELESGLKEAGFEQIRFFGSLRLDPPNDSDDRVFVAAARAISG